MAKIKSDEREDLKVLATSVGAALAARKVKYASCTEASCSSRTICFSQLLFCTHDTDPLREKRQRFKLKS